MTNPPEIPPANDARPALANPAVAQCFEAWTQASEAVYASEKSEYSANKAAAKAYRQALPALSGVANICDFIACTAYGILIEAIPAAEGARLLYAAQVARAADPPARQKSTAD
jgi:hypothetical protein